MEIIDFFIKDLQEKNDYRYYIFSSILNLELF